MHLDVGCGQMARGDVNVDLYIGDYTQGAPVINSKAIPNFILADAHFLPFKDKAFDCVTCYSALDHFYNPYQVLSEFRRVCSDLLVIEVGRVFREDDGGVRPHFYAWNKSEFEKLLRLFFKDVKVIVCGDLEKFPLLRGKAPRINRILTWIFPGLGGVLRATCRVNNRALKNGVETKT